MNKLILVSFFLGSGLFAFGQNARYDVRTVLSDSVNSKQDESAALLSADGKAIYFVRSFYSGNVGGSSGKQDIYYSNKKSDGSWSVAMNIGSPLNDEFHNAVCGVSLDGKRLYLNSTKIRQDKTIPGISLSNYQDGAWTMAKSVSTFKFPEKGFFQVFVSHGEDVAIVSFEGLDTKGLEDLYIMKKDVNGNFSDPIHLGESINSTGFETSPILSPDGKTLYFSSNGLGGQGDGDIFKTTRLDDSWTNWSKPENLGQRINTNGFDGSFSVDPSGNAFYISGEGSSGPGDIFTISMNPPPPPPPPAPVEVVKDSSTLATGTGINNKAIQPPPAPKRIDTLGQALFEFNSIVINPDSKESLQNVVNRLKKNKMYKIQVEGHTDDKGSEQYNQRLSERRALSVKRFLLKRGIASAKIKSQGFGELNPVDDNTTEEGRAKNRRVEIKYFIK